jgi:phospholipid/cholesterol/gamma-HCH transport system permease protein
LPSQKNLANRQTLLKPHCRRDEVREEEAHTPSYGSGLAAIFSAWPFATDPCDAVMEANPTSKIRNPTPMLARPFLAVTDWIADLGGLVTDWIIGLGRISTFSLRTFHWMLTRLPRKETILPSFYQIGVLSLPVVALTGTFIGMVLVVQSYVQFRNLHLEAKLGAVINMSLVRELGPVLAATMLAGRVGSAMAAELGTMRVTEQIDALASMGANPIHYLVVPRFLGCLMLIPALTIMADFMGVAGAFFYAVNLLGIDAHHYLENSQHFVGNFDLFAGVFKSLFFGAAIALIACYRGFNCDPGAEGVGRAATAAFVYSFVMILLLDLLLGIALDGVYFSVWPEAPKLF